LELYRSHWSFRKWWREHIYYKGEAASILTYHPILILRKL
jgi:hypothetical protein